MMDIVSCDPATLRRLMPDLASSIKVTPDNDEEANGDSGAYLR